MRLTAVSTGLFGRLADEYRRTLKAPEMEEPIDLVLYRPAGFVVAKLAARTPLTPNHLSIASLVLGVAAGVAFSAPTPGRLAAGACAYLACNVLDCADGQLARLTGRGSKLGYVVDGAIDYAATISVFLGLTLSLAARGLPWGGVAAPWLLGALALASMGWQCALLDRKRHAWSSRVLGRRDDPAAELAAFGARLDDLRARREGAAERALLWMYVAYRTGWLRFVGEARTPEPSPDGDWAARERPALRAAVWIGSSLHMTLLTVAALARRPELYFFAVITLGNAWALRVTLSSRDGTRRPPASELPSRTTTRPTSRS